MNPAAWSLAHDGWIEPMNNRETLITLMLDHGLERREIADLVSVDRDTVDRWLVSAESSKHLEIPDMAIELLALKLAAHKGSETDG
jgi:orotate phosphoribosyltransferase-like protein